MKANELSKTLKKLTKILDAFGNNELNDVVDELLELKKNNNSEVRNNKKDDDIEYKEIQRIIKKLNSLDASGKEKYLNNEIIDTRKVLLAIASELNISSLSNQNKEGIKYSILKNYERANMDKSIQSTRKK